MFVPVDDVDKCKRGGFYPTYAIVREIPSIARTTAGGGH